MVFCVKCGVDVKNLGDHLRRKRCSVQHIRKAERVAQRLKESNDRSFGNKKSLF